MHIAIYKPTLATFSGTASNVLLQERNVQLSAGYIDNMCPCYGSLGDGIFFATVNVEHA